MPDRDNGAAGERLQKVLAHAGVASRRAAEALILAGRVQVNGQTVTALGTRVRPTDRIFVDGRRVGAPEKPTYLMVNKPRGYVCTVRDPEGRPTILDLVDTRARVYPVGRLDWDSEGLVLLTNDGELTYALTHPSRAIEKVYEVTVRGAISDHALARLARGVHLADGPTAPARVKLLARDADASRLQIAIHEGRNRQVRRMCEAVGHPVKRLWRVQIGPIALGHLAPGRSRALSGEEIGLLRIAAGLAQPVGKGARPRPSGPAHRALARAPRRDDARPRGEAPDFGFGKPAVRRKSDTGVEDRSKR